MTKQIKSYDIKISMIKQVLIDNNITLKTDVKKVFMIVCNYNISLVKKVYKYMYNTNQYTYKDNGFLCYIQADILN